MKTSRLMTGLMLAVVCGCKSDPVPTPVPTPTPAVAATMPMAATPVVAANPKRVTLAPVGMTTPKPATKPPKATTKPAMAATKPAAVDLKVLTFNAKSVDLISAGSKTGTIRKGVRNYKVGPATASDGKRVIPITIVSVTHIKAGDLTVDDALADHTMTVPAMMAALKANYPTLTQTDDVTVVVFKPVTAATKP